MKVIELVQVRSAASSLTTNAYDLVDLYKYSIQVVFTGSDVVGTLKLQASLDNVNFFDIDGSTQAVAASEGQIWDVINCGYRYVRVVWTYTSGTGNMTMELYVKETVVKYA